MKILRASPLLEGRADLAGFMARVRRAEQRVLLLDYDGTLAPFRVERNEARPYPGVRELAEGIAAAPRSRVEVVSGRAAREVAALLAMNPAPEIWGSHGRERLSPGGRLAEAGELSAAAREGLREGRVWAEGEKLGDRCEEKTGCLAFHWRGLPAAEAAELHARVSAAWNPVAARAGLELRPFDGGLELRAPGRTKGSVVESILAEVKPGAVLAYLGDDQTDEDAFAALGARGLSVLVRADFRPTAADVWLEPPGELLDFLRDWRDACLG